MQGVGRIFYHQSKPSVIYAKLVASLQEALICDQLLLRQLVSGRAQEMKKTAYFKLRFIFLVMLTPQSAKPLLSATECTGMHCIWIFCGLQVEDCCVPANQTGAGPKEQNPGKNLLKILRYERNYQHEEAIQQPS